MTGISWVQNTAYFVFVARLRSSSFRKLFTKSNSFMAKDQAYILETTIMLKNLFAEWLRGF